MLSLIEDERVRCTSIMTAIEVGSYLALVDEVYRNKGGIEGQRAPLKTKTAITIRKRLVDDLRRGAVVPPIVIGVLASPEELAQLAAATSSAELMDVLTRLDREKLSIIDGMQRTTALNEANASDNSVSQRMIRVEFWATEFINSLIYRMLVLNTGQVPWELARQLETIYSQFLKQLSSTLGEEGVSIFLKDDQRRRVNAAQYQGSAIVEMLLVFSSRKADVEVRDKVAEDFARLDAIDTTSHDEFIGYFVGMLRSLVDLDRVFSKVGKSGKQPAGRFDAGRDVFGSFPAMAGFAAAVATRLFDEPGFAIRWEDAPRRMEEITAAMAQLTSKLDAMGEDQLRQFLQLDTLEELLVGRRGGVGRFEREFFKRAFSAMIAYADRLESMEPCWRA